MLKRLVITMVTVLVMFSAQPAMASDNYVDGVTTLEEIMGYTLEYHVDNPDVDQLVNGAIEGMLQTLEDPFTEYLSPELLKEFEDSLNGDYVGIGVKMMSVDGYAKIVNVFEDSPAARAGLRQGDLIIAVDGQPLHNLPLISISEKILGEEGTKVTITIRRNGQEFDVTVTRAAVHVDTIYSEILEDHIGYIEVSSFGESTAKEFAEILNKMKAKEIKGLIIDVRDNGGGYMKSAQRMVSQFVPQGKKVVGIVDKTGNEMIIPSFGPGQRPAFPVVILINYDSASASEIFAGALQDYYMAKLVGTPTYGKGTVQSVIGLENGGALKVTTAKYSLPGGKYIDGFGLTPDVQVVSPSLQMFAAKNIIEPTAQVTLTYTIDSAVASVNGEELAVLGMPYQKGQVSYLPLRFTMEALGYQVNWDDERDGIHMQKDTKELLVPSAGGTVHSVEIEDGIAYISTADLTALGIQCKVENQTIIITED